MRHVTITDSGGPRIVVRAPYDAAFQDDLKRTIPQRSRDWSGARWFIDRACLARVEACARRHFDRVEILRGDEAE